MQACPSSPVMAALALLLALAGCADIRQLTYPSDFVYLDDADVQDAMYRMAGSLRTLDELVAAETAEPGDVKRRAAIEDELRRLELRATALGAGSSPQVGRNAAPVTNHLLIDEHIDAFLTDVARARRFAARRPPSYYPVGKLVGGCNACHAER